MLFHSPEFISLLIITILFFYLLRSKRMYILAVANVLFYAASGINYLLLFLTVVFVTYYCSKRLSGKYGSIYFYIGLMVNIFNLLFFKYTGFVFMNINKLFKVTFPWQDGLLSSIILPIGISFYTFQLIAYLVDVKNKSISPCDGLIKFWVFIAFFGQLIAGPIMRGDEFLPQVSNITKYNLNADNIKKGFYYILLGISKKILFADFLAAKADHYFNQITALNTLDGWFATYLFAFQIYFDFSAYSEIAVGIGHLFNLDLRINFKSPYISSNPAEFWKRWHITLSSWIRDYIYIPLGGAKKGFRKQLLFLILAMSISGLWHGAAWTFIIWGIYHGVLSVLHKLYIKRIKNKQYKIFDSRIYKVICIFIYFHLTCIGWVLFRAHGIGNATRLIWRMLNPMYFKFDMVYALYFGFIALLYLLHVLEYYVRDNSERIMSVWENRIPSPVRALVYTIILGIVVLATSTEQNSFIYFQF